MSYPTLSKAIDGFLFAKSASGLSAYMIRNYKTDLLRFTEWLGDKQIDIISSKQMEQFIQYLRENFRITRTATTKIQPRKLSSKSIRNIHEHKYENLLMSKSPGNNSQTLTRYNVLPFHIQCGRNKFLRRVITKE